MTLPNLLPDNVLKSMPDFFPHEKLRLGLDLQGGSYVLLEAEQKSLVEGQETKQGSRTVRKNGLVQQLAADTRSTLREKKIGYQNLRYDGRTVTVRIRKPEDFEKARTALSALAEPIDQGVFSQGNAAKSFDMTMDGNLATMVLTDDFIERRTERAIEQSIGVLERRINALGTTEPIIQRQGLNRILIQVPGLDDPNRLRTLLGSTAKLDFQLLCDQQPTGDIDSFRPSPGCDILEDRAQDGIYYSVHTSTTKRVSGEDLTDSQPGFDSRTNEPIVSFRFNNRGANRFGRLTRDNVGRPFAIVLDNKVISAPVIREAILGGSGQISGSFTIDETNNLAILLRSGALPAKLVIVEERSVGPSLGADSVEAGFIAGMIGLAAVVCFILISYGLFGIFANIALAVNIALIVGVLSFLQATLTLPGIAGIVLTMGMAVDANVLIFERIREEVKQGRSPLNAIDTGYGRALTTILDANITTFIAAVILFGLGSGPIRGFSVTLGIGIITSVFTAFTVTRLLISLWVGRSRPKAVPI
ncbi:MAG: protein translocase subunit SecD [Hyphomicrobiales bacterium]